MRAIEDGAANAREASLPIALERAAEELDRLRGTGLDVEKAFCRVFADSRPSDPRDFGALQELDRLLQHLEGLALFLRGVAGAERRGAPVETAAAGLLNARLARALTGRVAPPEAAPGEAELF